MGVLVERALTAHVEVQIPICVEIDGQERSRHACAGGERRRADVLRIEDDDRAGLSYQELIRSVSVEVGTPKPDGEEARIADAGLRFIGCPLARRDAAEESQRGSSARLLTEGEIETARARRGPTCRPGQTQANEAGVGRTVQNDPDSSQKSEH